MNATATFPTAAPMPAIARILARFERDQLAGFIAVALDLIDTLDGDADLEDATDLEDDHALSRLATGYDSGRGPGCEVADTGEEDDQDTGIEDDPRGCDPESDYGGEEAGECEQMANDVPTVPCFALEPREDGKRAFVGYWNPGSFIGERAITSSD